MQLKSQLILGILVAVILGCSNTIALDDNLTATEAKKIAEEAYVFGMPLVYFSINQSVTANVSKPEGARAPYNQFAHFREFADPSNRTVVAWNVDTLYSIGTIDLTAEPIILTVPDTGDRWWLMQILDAWNDVPAAPGTRTMGNRGGNYALVGPNWKGELPPVHSRACGLPGGSQNPGSIHVNATFQMGYRLPAA